MKVLLVGQADSIFFEQYTKNIRLLRPDIIIDVFSYDNINGKYDLSACREITVSSWENSICKRIKGVRTLIYPFFLRYEILKFLKVKGGEYNIVHFKWIIPGITLLNKKLKKMGNIHIATLWGGEIEGQKLLYSQSIYHFMLRRFLNGIDFVTYFSEEQFNILRNWDINSKILYHAIYGSTIIEQINLIQKNESEISFKNQWNINSEKITISIGYSGKLVHQHEKILNIILANKNFIESLDKFCFILPFTHGGNKNYYKSIISLLDRINANYLFLSEKMTVQQVASLRLATDIMIQLSISDGRSASIIESFLAGSIIISGSWLPYKEFKEKGLFFYEMNDINNSLPETIINISHRIDDERIKASKNKSLVQNETWNYSIKRWIELYDQTNGIY